ncbi:MAG: hypothetical protein P4N60_20350 [Verrucomicrobiae bacterium]|nr:hypothetical protein [Verrucomicrobiae bacterium]
MKPISGTRGLPTNATIAGTPDATKAASNELQLKGPDGKFIISLRAGNHLKYDMAIHGKYVATEPAPGVTVDGKDFGGNTMFSRAPKSGKIKGEYPIVGGAQHGGQSLQCQPDAASSRTTKWQL